MTSSPSHFPTGTYRLQLQPAFGFADAAAAVPYIASLGVSHLHLSPVLQAVPGSTHGYDVVDHSRVSADLGGEDGLRALAVSAAAHGLGIVLDIVPNHMAVPAPESLNRPLWQTLREGPDSPYARWFDIDWTRHDGRVLLPVLGGPVEEVADELIVDGDVLRYHEHEFPLRAGTDKLALDELLAAQHFELAHWRRADTELNYRRFFTIAGLIALRQEDEEVFAATHATIVRLVNEGLVQGLRIDHPDGLADPRAYLARLRAAAPNAWIVVEKILADEERLPADWACDGTTGYDALRRVDNLFVDAEGAEPLRALHREQTGVREGFDYLAQEARAEVLAGGLATEFARLRRTLDRLEPLAGAGDIGRALPPLLAAFPTYRPYPGGGPGSIAAMAQALTGVPGQVSEAAREIAELALADGEFGTRFGQVAAALAAKGVEDRAFYRWYALSSLNEVGGSPDSIGLDIAGFHDACARMSPTTMTTLSTHDTKRSEDVRARLAVLAEVPEDWAERVHTWNDWSHPHRSEFRFGPDGYDTYLLWQTLVGAWPLSADRAVDYLRKAMREAARVTTWTDPNPDYEAASEAFVRAVLADEELNADIAEFVTDLDRPARAVSLGAKLVQLTMPGVPDVYQGGELALYTLVDPDNRAPVDFGREHGPLDALKSKVTGAALRLRREHPDWFAGGYAPLLARGKEARHAIAFVRGGEAITVATLLPAGLAAKGGWGGALLPLPPGRWIDALTGNAYTGQARLRHILEDLPVALLTRG
ncbi:malto-oligosyltrehalose synthase [Embleya scabrispora]|uniref:malto-oligosyltrehalose synthase n=1 Tax=Embleya scabrispora TaxID=159449 RepID=UPI0003644015|nr:malto-oligosyltrehalose synthase [Embleya scabrispora]MYS84350.1 malto-oligosyltrehalose synthase [Streptomyces sp. SID5474]